MQSRRRSLARSRKAFAFAASLQRSAQMGSAGRPSNRLGAIGANLSADQISNYAASAGFSGDALVTAVAVALGESGGNPNAAGDGGNSIGLWQIYRPDHPEFDGWHLTDPAINAQAAFQVYSDAGGNFRPWSAFKNGSYQAFLATAQQGVMADARGVPMDPAANDLPIASNLPASTKNALIAGAVAVGVVYAVKWLLE